MAVIGTFSQFTTARLALYASQASLSVTGNNISNINTPGYTRQRMDLVSLYSTGQGKYANIFNTNIGYGVLTNGASQLRDPYLDIRYRNMNTKLGAADEKSDALYQIGHILDEVGKGTGDLEGFGVIEAQFGLFYEALEDLCTNTGSEEYDDLVRAAANTLTAYFRKAASDLQDIKINKVGELNDAITDINGLLNNIRDLNSQIRTQNIYGDKALELRDARNLAIDQLSSYLPIDVTYSMERIDQWSEVEKLTITIKDSKGPDGQPIKLVDGIYGAQITMPSTMPTLNPNANNNAIVKAMNDLRDQMMAQTPKPSAADIETAVQAERARLEQTMGKYLLADGTATADWEKAVADATGQGYYNYDEKDQVNDNALYLMRVEQLVDQRGRVMLDKNDPSGKSQAIALDDVTFCTKSADAAVDETRVDSNALGIIQAIRETLTRKGEYSSQEDIDRDSYATIKRGIPYYERALDSLAQKFAEVLNGCNQMPLNTIYGFTTPNSPILDANGNQVVDANGTALTWDMVVQPVLDKDGNEVTDEDGNTIYEFKPVADDDGNPDNDAAQNKALMAQIELVREKAAKAPGYSFYDGGVLISNRGDNNDPTGITAANISISNAWSNHTVRILATKEKYFVDGNGNETSLSTTRPNIADMLAEFDKKRDYEAKDVWEDAAATLPVFHGSFREVFTAICGTLAADQKVTYGIAENYTTTTLNLDNDRLSVSGVDLNEEATSMMQFSKSYSAACRLLTTIDSMLDTLINGTAR